MARPYNNRRNNKYDLLVLLARIALGISLCATLYFALTQSDGRTSHIIPWDKALHYLCFLVLTGLSVVSFPRLNLAFIALPLAGFGWLIEYLQGLETFHRDKDFYDWIAEILAIATIYASILASHIRRNV